MAQRLVCPNVVNPGSCLQKAAVHAAGRRAGKHAAPPLDAMFTKKLFVQLPEGRGKEAGTAC